MAAAGRGVGRAVIEATDVTSFQFTKRAYRPDGAGLRRLVEEAADDCGVDLRLVRERTKLLTVRMDFVAQGTDAQLAAFRRKLRRQWRSSFAYMPWG